MVLAASAALAQTANTQWPLHSDGLTDLVEWLAFNVPLHAPVVMLTEDNMAGTITVS